MSDKRTRWVIEATSNLDSVGSDLSKIITLLKQQNDLTQQQTTQTLLATQRQREGIESVEAALKKQNTTIAQSTNQHKGALGLIKSEYDTLGKTLNGITQIMAGMFIVSQVSDYVKQVVAAKSAQDGFAVSLQNMLKSKVVADEINAQLMAIAIKSPFEVEQVQKVTTQLVGMGVAVQDIIPYINMLGDISAVVGTSKLPLIAKALLDVKNKGILMKQELNQFAENGIPLYDLLAESMGKTRDEVVKLAEAHTITFKQVESALKTATAEGGRYYGQMAAQSQTLAGQVANMADMYTLATAGVGDFFEDTLKGGIQTMQSVIRETIGSQAAITRLVAAVKAAVAAYVTYRSAMLTVSSAKNAAAASTVALAGAEVVATGATVTFAGAMNALKAAFVTYPIGAVITVLGALVTAYYAVSAATTDVTEVNTYQADQLRKSNKEFEIATKAVMQHTEGTTAYKEGLDKLIALYPEYFAGVSKEAINNNVLNGILMNVNESFQERIRLASLAYQTDELQQKAIELDRKQLEVVGQLRKEYEAISSANPNDEKFIAALKGQQTNLDKISAAMKEVLTFGLVKGDIYNASSLINEKKKIETEMIRVREESEKEQTIITARSLDQQTQLLIKKLNDNEITQKEFNEKYAELTDQKVAKEVGMVGAGEEKKKAAKKSSLEFALENQVKELKAQEQTNATKMQLLDAEEALDIERATRQIKRKSDEAERILSIQREYANKRQKLLESMIDYDMVDLKKVQEQADKEFQIRNTLSEDIEDLTIHINSLIVKEEEEKAARLIELGKEIFETQKDLNKAGIALGELEAVSNAKIWQDKALVVEKYYRDKVLGPALETSKKLQAIAQAEYDHYLKVFGPDNELTKAAFLNLEKTKTAATDAFREVGENTEKIAKLTVDRVIDIAQAAMQVVETLAANYVESTRLAADSLGTVADSIDDWTDKNRSALQEQLSDVTLTNEQREALIDASLNRESELVKRKSAMLEMKQQLEDTAAKTEATMAVVNAGLGAVVAFAKGDFVGGIIGVVETISAAFNRSAILQEQQQMKALRDAQRTAEGKIQLIQAELDARTQLHDLVLQQIDEEEKAFKDAANAEIDAAKDSFSAQKTELEAYRDLKVKSLNEQLDAIKDYYDTEITKAREAFAIKQGLDEQSASDSKALLEASSQFRNQTLDAWEDREVKRLEDERDRNLARAKSDDDYRQIAEFYATEIADVHKTKQDAMLDTSLAVKLGMEELSDQLKDTTIKNKNDESAEIKRLEDEKQVKAQEVQDEILKANTATNTAITSLETTLADTIKGLQDSIKDNATAMENKRKAENADYKDFAQRSQNEIFEQQKQLAILEIRMEIAKLKAAKRKWFSNKRALDDAIGEMEGLIGSITGGGGPAGDWEPGPTVNPGGGGEDPGNNNPGQDAPAPKFNGDTWLKRTGGEPYGLDTIPIRAHVGERIMQAYINAKLPYGLPNEELADGYLKYQKLLDNLPNLNLHVNASGQLNMPVKSLAIPPARKENTGPMEVVNQELRREIRGLTNAVDKLKILNVQIDGNAISISEQMANQKINYYDKIFND